MLISDEIPNLKTRIQEFSNRINSEDISEAMHNLSDDRVRISLSLLLRQGYNLCLEIENLLKNRLKIF